MNLSKPALEASNWKKSLLWLLLAATCFNTAYASSHYPAAGLLMFGYAFFLIRLADQPSVRRAFYFGLTAGFFCDAPQLFFFYRIFNAAAFVLWLVVAFWVGLFAAIVSGGNRRWGKGKTAWLIPIVWTGLEYFRSELYYLKFSWLNVGYASATGSGLFGMYGLGLLVFSVGSFFSLWRHIKISLIKLLAVLGLFAMLYALAHPPLAESKSRSSVTLSLVGIQMEFPAPSILPKALDRALSKNPDAQIFVLSEYTLDGPVPDAVKDWCRQHARFLVVGGEDFVTNGAARNYYNTAFVVGTNGEIVFKQVKCVPIQFFRDGLPAPEQQVWNSPWGKIGFCVCYDLSYTRVTDELVRQGAQLLIVPTMDVEDWGRHQHELHARVAPVRAAEYGIPIFRLCSSGISQAVTGSGQVIAQAPMPGSGDILAATLRLPARGSLPLDRWLAPICVGITGVVMAILLWLTWLENRAKKKIGGTISK